MYPTDNYKVRKKITEACKGSSEKGNKSPAYLSYSFSRASYHKLVDFLLGFVFINNLINPLGLVNVTLLVPTSHQCWETNTKDDQYSHARLLSCCYFEQRLSGIYLSSLRGLALSENCCVHRWSVAVMHVHIKYWWGRSVSFCVKINYLCISSNTFSDVEQCEHTVTVIVSLLSNTVIFTVAVMQIETNSTKERFPL